MLRITKLNVLPQKVTLSWAYKGEHRYFLVCTSVKFCSDRIFNLSSCNSEVTVCLFLSVLCKPAVGLSPLQQRNSALTVAQQCAWSIWGTFLCVWHFFSDLRLLLQFHLRGEALESVLEQTNPFFFYLLFLGNNLSLTF